MRYQPQGTPWASCERVRGDNINIGSIAAHRRRPSVCRQSSPPAPGAEAVLEEDVEQSAPARSPLKIFRLPAEPLRTLTITVDPSPDTLKVYKKLMTRLEGLTPTVKVPAHRGAAAPGHHKEHFRDQDGGWCNKSKIKKTLASCDTSTWAKRIRRSRADTVLQDGTSSYL